MSDKRIAQDVVDSLREYKKEESEKRQYLDNYLNKIIECAEVQLKELSVNT